MSTIKADAIEAATGTNTDLVLTGKGAGVPDIQTNFKVSGTAGLPLSDLRAGTAGNLITYDASGNPAAVATGTVGQVLTSGGAGVAPTMQDAPGGGLILLETATASASASLDFTAFDSSLYSSYQFVFEHLRSATANQNLYIRTSANGGSTFDSGASDYAYTTAVAYSTTRASTGSLGAAYVTLMHNTGTNNNANDFCSGVVTFFGPADSKYSNFCWDANYSYIGSYMIRSWGMGTRNAAAAVNGVQFLFNASNIASGTIRMYGIKKA